MTVKETMAKAQTFAKENLTECCKDLLELSGIGILSDGKFTELRSICNVADFGCGSGINIAKGLVTHLAMDYVVNGGWVSSTERLPELRKDDDVCGLLISDRVLVVDKYENEFTARLTQWDFEDGEEISDKRWCQYGRDAYTYELNQITHWMPLPALPKKD